MSSLDRRSCTLSEFDLPPLSQEADEALRRARVFLFSARLPAWQTLLLRAGYTPKQHEDGVSWARILSGEGSFAEWRLWRSLRPPRDPDLPERVTQLSAFARRWLPQAQETARGVIDDPDVLAVILNSLSGLLEYPSETWKANAFAACLRGMESEPLYQPVWTALLGQGIQQDLAVLDRALSDVQAYIRDAKLDRAELDDIGRSREHAAVNVRRWLDERREQLVDIDEEDLAVLALGPVVPPPGFSPPIALLARFRATGSA
jgi:hypothetical protein